MLTNRNFKEIFKLQILIFLGHGGFLTVHAKAILRPVVQELFFILTNLIFSLLNMEQERIQTAELNFYALWILLKVAQDQQVKNLQVLGDSKMLIEWENGRNQITNMELIPINDEVR